jgi:hypothetical protein
MKKNKYLIPVLILFLLVGCGSKLKLPDNPVVFKTKENDGYMSIIRGNKEYVPFCAFDPSQVGDCIGYYKNDGNKVFVCKLKGQSPDEWIVDVLSLSNCNEGMILREKSTTNIPNGLSSDYEWNK